MELLDLASLQIPALEQGKPAGIVSTILLDPTLNLQNSLVSVVACVYAQEKPMTTLANVCPVPLTAQTKQNERMQYLLCAGGILNQYL